MPAIKLTEKQEELVAAALSGLYTMILFGGAVGGAKTAGLFLLYLLAQKVFPGIQVYFVRKDLATIERNSYATWNELTGKYGVPESLLRDYRADQKNPRLEFRNGSNLFFFGENYERDKKLLRWSGLIPNWFFADEINEITFKAYKKMYERAGRYQLPKGNTPPPLIVGTCNPSQGWVKSEIYDRWKKGTLPDHVLYIPSKVTDNPHLPEAYLNNLKNLPRYEYEVYVEGNWDINLKTGGEFLKDFVLDQHIKVIYPHPDITFHISIDSNVEPYIAVTIWQLTQTKTEGWLIEQVHELPIKDPNNTARKAGKVVGEWLEEIGYQDKVFLYGDPTTKARNNIDDEKKTFYDLFVEGLQQFNYRIEDRFYRRAPSVSATGDFINAIFEKNIFNLVIHIAESCKVSINDYIETKQDKDGGILKKREMNPNTGISYEPFGHITDTMRYFICKVFESEFKQFINRLSDYSDNTIPTQGTELLDGF